ncbi:hypothetical protein BDW67DRAFT_170984 [Aspergillus spinulosporus]
MVGSRIIVMEPVLDTQRLFDAIELSVDKGQKTPEVWLLFPRRTFKRWMEAYDTATRIASHRDGDEEVCSGGREGTGRMAGMKQLTSDRLSISIYNSDIVHIEKIAAYGDP